MANITYNEGVYRVLDRSIDLVADTIKAMLVSSTYSPNKDDQFIDAGGASDPVDARIGTDQTLSGKAVGKDNTGDFAYMDANDPTWTAVAGGSTIAGVVIYKDTGVATTSRILAYIDVTDTATNGGDITLQIAAPSSGALMKFAN
jgi:hypothetical protein